MITDALPQAASTGCHAGAALRGRPVILREAPTALLWDSGYQWYERAGGARSSKARLIAMVPTADGSVQSYVVAASLCPVLLTMLPAGVTHPAGADVGACVVQHPVALCRGEPSRPAYRQMIGQVARSMGSCMRGFRSEFAAGESNPQRTVGICAGQGGASRGSRPCPLPPDEDGQGLRCLHRVPSPATPFSHVRNLTPPTDSQLLSHDTPIDSSQESCHVHSHGEAVSQAQ